MDATSARSGAIGISVSTANTMMAAAMPRRRSLMPLTSSWMYCSVVQTMGWRGAKARRGAGGEISRAAGQAARLLGIRSNPRTRASPRTQNIGRCTRCTCGGAHAHTSPSLLACCALADEDVEAKGQRQAGPQQAQPQPHVRQQAADRQRVAAKGGLQWGAGDQGARWKSGRGGVGWWWVARGRRAGQHWDAAAACASLQTHGTTDRMKASPIAGAGCIPALPCAAHELTSMVRPPSRLPTGRQLSAVVISPHQPPTSSGLTYTCVWESASAAGVRQGGGRQGEGGRGREGRCEAKHGESDPDCGLSVIPACRDACRASPKGQASGSWPRRTRMSRCSFACCCCASPLVRPSLAMPPSSRLPLNSCAGTGSRPGCRQARKQGREEGRNGGKVCENAAHGQGD